MIPLTPRPADPDQSTAPAARRKRAHPVLASVCVAIVTFAAIGAANQPKQVATPGTPQPISELDATSYVARQLPEPGSAAPRNRESFVTLWGLLDPRQQSAALAGAPELLGNAAGVLYQIRDQANRLTLDQALRSAKRNTERSGNPTGTASVRHLQAIDSAARSSHNPNRLLTSLVLDRDRPPLAVIAVGDPDTADTITIAVPGMGTYTNDMQMWTRAAENIQLEQTAVDEDRTHSVFAWIGYHAPPPGVDAAMGEHAKRGAPALISEIKAIKATRPGNVPAINIAAHSYGATLTANALASEMLDIHTVVMLGSAGVEPRIANAKHLYAGRVYAGEAPADKYARWGRLARTDPRSERFGALHLDTDGDSSNGLYPVTGHEPILHSPWNDDLRSGAWSRYTTAADITEPLQNHLGNYGYLDANSESLHNLALATVGPAASLTATRCESCVTELRHVARLIVRNWLR